MLPCLTAWFIAGLAGGSFVRYLPVLLLILLIIAAVAFTLWERGRPGPAGADLAAYAALLAGVLYWPLFTLLLSPEPPAFPGASGPASLVGRIVAPVTAGPDRLIAIVDPHDRPAPGESDPAVRRIRLTWKGPDAVVGEGDLVAFTTRLQAPRGTTNPGGFDYGAHLRRQGLDALGFVSGPGAVRIVEPGLLSPRWALWAHVDHWRHRIHRAATASLDGPALGLYLGLVTGEQGLIDAALREDFVATGTVHILSISGSHLGLISLLAFVGARFVCRRLPAFVILFLNRYHLTATRLAVLATVPLTVGYTLLAGAEVATMRALLMILLVLVAVWLGRDKCALPILSTAALVTLLLDPRALYDVSFQLSYGSVLAIALLADGRRASAPPDVPLEEDGHPIWYRARAWCANTLILSLVVTAVTLPLVALYFRQFAWVSPIANLLLVPMAGLLIPMSLASACALLIGSADTLPLAPLIESGLTLLMKSVSLLAQLPAVSRHVAAPSVPTIVVYFGLCLLLARAATPKRRRIAAAGCLVALLCWWTWPHRTLPPDAVRVTVMDVGQGDATLIELPGGATALIDAGPRHERYDVGAAVVGPLLWDRGITRIDHAIGTHPQLDHVGGFAWLIRHFPVAHYWGNGMERQERFFRDLQAALAERGLSERVPREGEPLAVGGPCRLTAVNGPSATGAPASRAGNMAEGTDQNNVSLVTRLDCGTYAMLFAADMEGDGLARMLSKGQAHQATILKVPHHGARSSLSLPWIRSIRPQAALLSVGAHNPYRHPHPEVVAAYRDSDIPLFRTDRDGALTITGSLTHPVLTVTMARQSSLEKVSMDATLWETERGNYRRLCRRYFDTSCPAGL